jgi:hypothetical protein
VTVCIAATCRWLEGIPIAMGVSDRMLTSGDIQFMPPQTKINTITNSIYAMGSGDATIHGEVFPKVYARVADLVSKNPTEWARVEDVADMYGEEMLRYKNKIIARLVLEPLGLTWQTFLSKQKDMSPDWLDSITDRILEYSSAARTIVAGLDATGAHIYVVDGTGKVSCVDKVGFAAIGIGKRHAESEFMFSGHTPDSEFPDSLLRLYIAKKRAEVAPGVGPSTDMFVVPSLGKGFVTRDEELISGMPQLHDTYRELITRQDAIRAAANKNLSDFMEEEMKKYQEQTSKANQQIKPPDTEPPSNS